MWTEEHTFYLSHPVVQKHPLRFRYKRPVSQPTQYLPYSLSLELKISLSASTSVNNLTLSAESENPSSTGNRYK